MTKRDKGKTLYLDSETAQILKEQSQKNGMTQAAFIRSLLAQKNELEEKRNELLELQEQLKMKMSEQKNKSTIDNEKIDYIFVLLKVLFEAQNRQSFQFAASLYEKEIKEIFKK
jgi:small-conductance mechanosensitive channel